LPSGTDCFAEFNPPSDELAKALKDISNLYVGVFNWLIDQSQSYVNPVGVILDVEPQMKSKEKDEIGISGYRVYSLLLLSLLFFSLYNIWNIYTGNDRRTRPSASHDERMRLVQPR